MRNRYVNGAHPEGGTILDVLVSASFYENAKGFYYIDGVHETASGYADEATALAQILMAA
jgi:hypothetical protein